jgi:hypothetical protein
MNDRILPNGRILSDVAYRNLTRLRQWQAVLRMNIALWPAAEHDDSARSATTMILDWWREQPWDEEHIESVKGICIRAGVWDPVEDRLTSAWIQEHEYWWLAKNMTAEEMAYHTGYELQQVINAQVAKDAECGLDASA